MPIVGPASAVAVSTRSLASLRTTLAKRLRVLAPEQGPGTVSALGSDPLTAFSDIGNTDAYAREALFGAWALFTSGGNKGVYRLIAGNQDGEISLAQALLAAPNVGDGYEIYRRFPPPTFRDAFNYAIRESYPLIYSSWEQEVAENPNTLEYEYPTLVSPAIDSVVTTAPGVGHTYSYQVVVRDDSGDALPGTATQVTNGVALSTSSYNTVNFTEVTNADSYIILRSVDGAASQQLTTVTAVAQGQPVVVVDQGQFSPAAYAALSPNPPSLFEVRQLWRRVNPAQTGPTVASPPIYQRVAGDLWTNLGDRVRVRYRTSSGMFLAFVGLAPLALVTNDTDNPSQLLPDELLLAGAATYLYTLMLEGEASSAKAHYQKRLDAWSQEFTRLQRLHAMPVLGQETHPPVNAVTRARYLGLGPAFPR